MDSKRQGYKSVVYMEQTVRDRVTRAECGVHGMDSKRLGYKSVVYMEQKERDRVTRAWCAWNGR